MQLEFEEDGFCHDLMHPRYIAALLRIGDLLDIDNDRFTDWFKKAMENNGAFIPKTIKLHYLKHQATSTIYITPSLIRVYSDVRIENHFEALQVADLIGEWFLYIKSDFDKLKYNWAEITHGYFGAGPGVLDLKIWLNGLPYEMEKQKITLSYSHRFLEKLAEGKDLYSNSYTGFRELLQNSVDASLLKLWQDVKNHCVDSLLPKDFIDKLDSIPSDIKDQKKAIDDLKINFYDLREKVFNNYPIEVHLVNDSMNEQIIIVIHDYGIGFTKENIKYIAQVGSDKENSPVFKNLISSMPEWLYPAGYFGIGIQSVFTLTDQLEYFSFNTEGSNLHIIIRDNKCSERTIQFIEMDSEFSKQNFKNKNRGTYTVLKLKYNKYFKNHNYIYFDATFNEKAKPENAALREIVSAFRGLRDNGKGDYFSIKYREWERKYINGVLDYSEINNTKGNIKRNSFFMKEYNILGIQNVGLKSKGEDFNLAFHFPSIGCWDWKTNYYWAFDITLFEIVNNKIFFPPTTAHPITLLYKFLKIKDISSLKGEEDFRRVRYSRFVHTTVNIFSKDVSEYLTIDRERLKNTSLQEKDINEYFYNCIRTLWRELIEGKQSVDVFLKDIFYNSRKTTIEFLLKDQFSDSIKKPEELNNNFSDSDEQEEGISSIEKAFLKNFISVLFLFRQVSDEMFSSDDSEDCFFDKVFNDGVENIRYFRKNFYRNKIDEKELDRKIKRLKNEVLAIEIGDLENNNQKNPTIKEVLIKNSEYRFSIEVGKKQFNLRDTLFKYLIKNVEEVVPEPINIVTHERYLRLPHEIFQIDKIRTYAENIANNKRKMKIYYVFKVRDFSKNYSGVYMDGYAQFFDHYLAITQEMSKLVRTTFKPNNEFNNLIVFECPKEYQFTNNWLEDLDGFVNGMILSPFSQGSVKVFEEYRILIRSKLNDLKRKDEESFKKELSTQIDSLCNMIISLFQDEKSSEYIRLNRCIKYIIKDEKKREEDSNNNLNVDQKIRLKREAYFKYINLFCHNFIISIVLNYLSLDR